MGRTGPSVNLGPPHIPEIVRAKKLKFCTPIERENSTCRKCKFFARGVSGCSAPSVTLGPPQIFFARGVSARPSVNVGYLISYLENFYKS